MRERRREGSRRNKTSWCCHDCRCLLSLLFELEIQDARSGGAERWQLPTSCQIPCLIPPPRCCRLQISLFLPLSATIPQRVMSQQTCPSLAQLGRCGAPLTETLLFKLPPPPTRTLVLPGNFLSSCKAKGKATNQCNVPRFQKEAGVRTAAWWKGVLLNLEESPGARTCRDFLCGLHFGTTP